MDTLLEGDPTDVGPYRLVGRLGAGGMGKVNLARSPSGRPVAVKVVRPELAEVPEFRRRFRREIEAAQRVGGFWTAAVVDADPDAQVPWVATAHVDAPDLGSLVAAQGPLPEPQVRRLGAGLAEALRDIHRAGLVHRDLKPSNILVTDDGPRVIDFGIAKALEGGTALTGTGAAMGTPAFMSPEQVVGAGTGTESDVFSLGSVLAFAATGHGPFGIADSAHALLYRVVHEEPDLAAVPAGLRLLLTHCLQKSREQRPSVKQCLKLLTAPTPTEVQLPIRQEETRAAPQMAPAPYPLLGGAPEYDNPADSDTKPPVDWWSVRPRDGSQLPEIPQLLEWEGLPLPKVPVRSGTVSIGDRVEHDDFGRGTVVGLRGSGDETQLVVNFDRRGSKRLLLRYAPLWAL
ncbi:serine/threonine-protein kinase [Streptomyces roseus]|uniref:serine/threonine-protein kinase n=1 Tax=Streptomyces roseus TaxID=66430 RepID=UPI00069E97D9